MEFKPDDVSGLSIWLKADSITGISDEDEFGFWGDSSSSDHDFSQSTADKKPTYIASVPELNNKPAVRFDGEDDVFVSNDTFSFGDHSVFVVYQDEQGGGNDKFTKLLLNADGTDGATTFTDSSASARTVTVGGNAQIDTAQSKFGGASALFDGTNDSLSVADSEDFNFGNGDFTIDLWVRFNAFPNNAGIVFYDQRSSNGDAFNLSLDVPGGGADKTLNIADSGGLGLIISRIWNPSLAVWYHVAAVRSGNDFKLFIDGVQLGVTATNSGTLNNQTGTIDIGLTTISNVNDFDGHIDEYRVSKGIARWTENFTPPAGPFN